MFWETSKGNVLPAEHWACSLVKPDTQRGPLMCGIAKGLLKHLGAIGTGPSDRFYNISSTGTSSLSYTPVNCLF